MTRYEEGRRFEYRVLTRLRADGWVCTRTPASKQPFDVVALKRGERPLLIQCKLDGVISSLDRARLVSVAHAAGAVAVLAYRSGRGGIEFEFI